MRKTKHCFVLTQGVLRKTRVQEGTFKNEVFPRYPYLNFSRSAQTVAQDRVEAKASSNLIDFAHQTL